MKYSMLGDANNPGPVRLSDVYDSDVGGASAGVAASQKALYEAYNSLNSRITTVSSSIIDRFQTQGGITDANVLFTSGTYNTDTNTANLPNAAIGIIIVFKIASSYLIQIYVATYAEKLYFRTRDYGRWMSWITLH